MVFFRVDSSVQIGSGHLMRCLTLAQQLKRRGGKAITFICRDLEGNLSRLVNERGFGLELLPRASIDGELEGYAQWLTVKQEQDADETINVLKKYGHVECVVVDSYAIDENWEHVVRPYTDEIFVIDDLANRKHDCDVLLDQNYYLNKDDRYKGLVPEHCKLLLGPEHALLRDEFYQAKEKMKPRSGKLNNILVFYGGADTTDETTKAIEALSELKDSGELVNVKITIVVGGNNPRKDIIAALCHEKGFEYLYQVNNMAELMSEADLMLGAGGTTTWERCFLSLPAIVTAVAENQLKVCEDCAETGLIDYLGYWKKVTEDDVCEAIRICLSSEKCLSMQKKIRQIFD